MVVPAGGAWLALHVLLLLLLLAAKPTLVSMAVTSPASASSPWGSGHVSDNVTAHDSSGQQQADMPMGQPYYNGQGMMESRQADSMLADGASSLPQDTFHIEDIQVGCRELRAKRYISDGFCTSTKPIKEVVCAGTCLPIRNLPWYAEFVKVWAKSKLREWQCEEDIVRRKTVSLLCRNGDYRTYRIKVVKSCKCKRMISKHNRTVSGEGKKKKKKNKKKRKKDRRRRGRKNRKGEKKNRREEQEKEEEEEEEIDVSQTDQRQDGSRPGKERRGRKRKRPGEQEERNSEAGGGQVAGEDSANSADSDRHKAVAHSSP